MSICDPNPKARLIAVVGPSGAGKDGVMAGLIAVRPAVVTARRVVARTADAKGEVSAAPHALYPARA